MQYPLKLRLFVHESTLILDNRDRTTDIISTPFFTLLHFSNKSLCVDGDLRRPDTCRRALHPQVG